MNHLLKTILLASFALVLFLPNVGQAKYKYDLSVDKSDIRFSPSKLVAGKKARIYVKVRNVGEEDMRGRVSFYNGTTDLGDSQSFAAVADGVADAFIDFTVPSDDFTITVKIVDTTPADDGSGNNSASTNLIAPYLDTDGDGITNDEDGDDDNDGLPDDKEKLRACPNNVVYDSDGDGRSDGDDVFPCDVKEWRDADGDKIGDNADPDDDNDGWSDEQEKSRGTDPFKVDTDGDGVSDAKDTYPLDPKKSLNKVVRDLFSASSKTATVELNESLAQQQVDALLQEGEELGTNTTTTVANVEDNNDDQTNIVSNVEGNNLNEPQVNNVYIKYGFVGLVMFLIIVLVVYVMRKSSKTDLEIKDMVIEPKKDSRILDLSKMSGKKRKL